MSSKLNVFITGSSGYIGGGIFSRLIENKSKYNITALIRESEKAKKLQELGANTVIGSLDDFELLQKQAEQSDIIFHTADSSDHVNSAKAFIAGLKNRGSQSGVRKPIYIHTSGTGVIMDFVKGENSSDKVYSDDIPADTHENIPDTAFHRNVDLLVYDAGKSGLVDCFIVCPPLIYGTSNGPFNRISQQVPGLIRSSIKNGRAVYVGKGANIWSHVHIEDLADFYMLLLNKALSGEAPKNDDGYYFVENGSHNFKDLAEHIGGSLVKLGQIKDPTPVGIVDNEDVIPKMLAFATGGNSRSRAVKARKLGWNPHAEKLFDTLDDTVQRIIQK